MRTWRMTYSVLAFVPSAEGDLPSPSPGEGPGLALSKFVNNDFDAYNIAAVLIMPQVFMSGAFFPLPPMTVLTLAGHEIGAFDFLPATHGMLALRQVFVGGAGPSEIAFRLGMMAVLSALYFAVGVTVFGQRQMRHGG